MPKPSTRRTGTPAMPGIDGQGGAAMAETLPRGTFAATCGECLLLATGLDGRAALRIRHMLERMRFRVREAGSPGAALDMAANCPPMLVLAVADVMESFTWRLRARLGEHVARHMLRLAILPDHDHAPERALRLMMAGVDDCLVWPFSRQMLARRLARLEQFA